jgi:hypothetical protein
MVLGRSTSGAIKIKTEDGLRAVSCGCCATPFGLLASATSAGGGLGCAMGDAVQTYFIPPPYQLRSGRTYKLRIEFSSGDGLFHSGSFYQANYTSTSSFELNWETTSAGTSGNPWSISNSGKTIRFSLEDSENCGGSNGNTQSGTAESIFTPSESVTLDFSFNGIAELEAVGFENIQFYLEDAQ